jgi:predicted transcriptional regulator
MAAKAEVLSVRVPADVQANLQRLAEERNVPRDDLINEALSRYIDDETDYHAAIDEALKEAEAGIFISGDKFLDWIKSWGTENELLMPEPDIFPEKTP